VVVSKLSERDHMIKIMNEPPLVLSSCIDPAVKGMTRMVLEAIGAGMVKTKAGVHNMIELSFYASLIRAQAAAVADSFKPAVRVVGAGSTTTSLPTYVQVQYNTI